MNDTLPVGFRECVRHVDGASEQLVPFEWTTAEAFRQRLAFEELHHQKGDPIGFADVVEHADVGMAQGRDSARLAFEPLPQARHLAQMLGKNLDRDGAVEAGVGGAVYLAHAAGSQEGVDAVGAELVPDERHRFRFERPDQLHGGRRRHEVAGVRITGKQRLDLAPQRVVPAARLPQERRPRRFGSPERFIVETRDVLPAVRLDHAIIPPRSVVASPPGTRRRESTPSPASSGETDSTSDDHRQQVPS